MTLLASLQANVLENPSDTEQVNKVMTQLVAKMDAILSGRTSFNVNFQVSEAVCGTVSNDTQPDIKPNPT